MIFLNRAYAAARKLIKTATELFSGPAIYDYKTDVNKYFCFIHLVEQAMWLVAARKRRKSNAESRGFNFLPFYKPTVFAMDHNNTDSYTQLWSLHGKLQSVQP